MMSLNAGYVQFMKSIVRIVCVICLGSVFGCSNQDYTDLKDYITQIKSRSKSTIEPLPEVKVVEPFIFKPDGVRDPFRPIERFSEPNDVDVGVGGGIRPDNQRRREELESFSLDALRMVGTLTMNSGFWGLVRANDGTIYHIQEGNYMGRNHGKIIRILEDRIELIEIIPDAPGKWREQQASLALVE